ncbi:S-layer homology domain-containing protein [Longirhabdus pacifica]|uniref:S-layer homology domain-containing protein n=1 Tax=Longirhabdus pacifica TaxID=2305227 RepID=UPI0013E8CD0D|nr:S-layer homology domain-containing protein [Longirhabdus pacifica]
MHKKIRYLLLLSLMTVTIWFIGSILHMHVFDHEDVTPETPVIQEDIVQPITLTTASDRLKKEEQFEHPRFIQLMYMDVDEKYRDIKDGDIIPSITNMIKMRVSKSVDDQDIGNFILQDQNKANIPLTFRNQVVTKFFTDMYFVVEGQLNENSIYTMKAPIPSIHDNAILDSSFTISFTTDSASQADIDTQHVTYFHDSPITFLRTLSPYLQLDIDASHWAYRATNTFIRADIVSGYHVSPYETYVYPDQPMTRAEMVSTLAALLGYESTENGHTYFEDVNRNDWYSESVAAAYEANVISGTDAEHFEPDRHITRDEMITMVVRAFSGKINMPNEHETLFKDVEQYWATTYIQTAQHLTIATGYTDFTFRPYQVATRAEVFSALYKASMLANVQLPSNEALITSFSNYYTAWKNTYETKKSYYSTDWLSSYTTGFYAAVMNMNASFYDYAQKEGFDVYATYNPDPSVEVLFKSELFAMIEVTDAHSKLHVTKDGETVNYYDDKDTTGTQIYYMKKDAQGAWKLYDMLEYSA